MAGKGKIYLSGGGSAEKTVFIDKCFLNDSLKKEILFVPIAKTTNQNGYAECFDWFTSKFNKISKGPINASMILDFYSCKSIDQSQVVYIGGGNTFKLLKLMNESGFSSILKNYVQNGGIVYGASAGAVLMGKDISTYIEEKYAEENKKNNYTISEGFAVVGNYSILTHYKESSNELLSKYFKKNNNPVIAIPEGGGLIVKDNHIMTIGDKSVPIFENEMILGILNPGTKFTIN